ncbi:MAG: hypothetical protein Q9216_003955 [Gyalolechia sp. 2 TL-2023]
MVLPTSKKRKHESTTKPKVQRPVKKFKKQTHYSSSSSSTSADETSDFPTVNLADSASDPDQEEEIHAEASLENDLQNDTTRSPPSKKHVDSSPPSSSDSESNSSLSSISNSQSKPKPRSTSKRNDPTAFATSISSILTTKLPTSTRTDPVLARSSSAHAANTEIREGLLEKRARQQLRAEKKALLEKGRVKDVLLGIAVGEENAEGQREEGAVGKIMEEEKRLKKTAQRGVVKLFNAVRMAQVRGEEARKEAMGKGIVGAKRREEKVAEMSKKGFLELVASGGGKGKGKSGKMSGEGIEEG